MTKKKKLSILIITTVIIALALLFGLIYLNSVNNYQKAVKNITLSNIDISQIPDGRYIGECDVDFIYAKVEVTVLAGAITKIDLLEHKTDKGGPAEKITDVIVKEQRLDVDTISGATNSSKVIIKAVENALLQ